MNLTFCKIGYDVDKYKGAFPLLRNVVHCAREGDYESMARANITAQVISDAVKYGIYCPFIYANTYEGFFEPLSLFVCLLESFDKRQDLLAEIIKGISPNHLASAVHGMMRESIRAWNTPPNAWIDVPNRANRLFEILEPYPDICAQIIAGIEYYQGILFSYAADRYLKSITKQPQRPVPKNTLDLQESIPA